MKKFILLLLVALSSLSMVSGQVVQNSVKGIIATVEKFESNADSIYLSFNLDVRSVDISSQQSVVVTPKIYKSSNKYKNLSSIILRGRNSAKSYSRALTFNRSKGMNGYSDVFKSAYKVFNYYGDGKKDILREGGVIKCDYAVAREEWMDNVEVALVVDTYGCCNKENNGILRLNTNIKPVKEVKETKVIDLPQLSMIEPEKAVVKRRDVKYSASLMFKVNSYFIDPTLGNNKMELNYIDDMMRSVVSDPDYTITAVKIIGHASPEGSLESNQKLSENRARSLERVLKGRYHIDPNLYNISFGGENWDGLIPLIEESSMNYKYEVLDIIKNVDVLAGRETRLMNLHGGEPYRYMLKNFFPLVRLVEVDVEYTVESYDVARSREIIEIKPENLSLEEMYKLSKTYDVDSEEFLDIFKTAVMLYPDDEVAVNNALVAYLANGDIEAASALAQRMSNKVSSAEAINTLGSYYMMIGEYEKAEKLLRKALEMGDDDAINNLKELYKKMGSAKRGM